MIGSFVALELEKVANDFAANVAHDFFMHQFFVCMQLGRQGKFSWTLITLIGSDVFMHGLHVFPQTQG